MHSILLLAAALKKQNAAVDPKKPERGVASGLALIKATTKETPGDVHFRQKNIQS